MNDQQKRHRDLQFPRTSDLPSQSPKYWVKEKDRYLRQLLIEDIEALTGRPLFVYFAQLDQEINHTDPDDLSEILLSIDSDEADFFIQTPGGSVDATEKIISVLRARLRHYRVLIPSWAKSAGTVISLSSDKIMLGMNSELGPIDPQWVLDGTRLPCELIAQDPTVPPRIQAFAKLASARMKQMAEDLLRNGMMRGKEDSQIIAVIEKISNSTGYMSHGAVIDFDEAKQLGLDVDYLTPDDKIWQRIWLLYCMYDYDTKVKNLGRVCESSRYSIGRPRPTVGK